MGSKTHILVNFVELPFVCISLFFDVGMKDDSICGISHLTEHVIIEELMKKEPELFRKNLINAYVDKEFTCFYATALRENADEVISVFSRLIDCMDECLSKDIMESQKNIIYKIENERILSNPQLINILLLEQLAFTGNVKNHTVVNEAFLTLGEEEIRKFCRQAYLSSSKHLIISGAGYTPQSIKEFQDRYDSMPVAERGKNDSVDERTSFRIPLDKLENANDARRTVAITMNDIGKAREYYALHIICLLYKVLLNNLLKETDFFIKDITVKLYTEKAIVFFSYNAYYDKTLTLLQGIELENCSTLFRNLKKHFLYGYLRKSGDLLAFNKEIYKMNCFFGEYLSYKNMVEFIDSASFDDIVLLHKKMLHGEYMMVPEFISG